MSNSGYLALRLEGPLQAWGFDSQFNRRNTGLMPTKSAIAGMCCAASGYARGSTEETNFLAEFRKTKMTAVAIPRKTNEKKELLVRRLQDYHTVQDTITAKGDKKKCHITRRQYLNDAAFGVILEGESDFLSQIATALRNPVWGIWLGRKACIPSAPVFVGLKSTEEEALTLLIGTDSLAKYTYQIDAKKFEDGKDTLSDVAESFAIEKRNQNFSPRRVLTSYSTQRS